MQATLNTTKVAVKNVLVPVDFSLASKNALTMALAIAGAYGAKVHLVHAITLNEYPVALPEGIPPNVEMVRRLSEENMAKLEKIVKDSGVKYETVLEAGTIWDVISDDLRKKKIDLVVVGTHAPVGLEKLLAGSVAEEILRAVDCPVMTVGPHVKPGMLKAGKFHEVLCANDFRPESLEAINYAAALAQEHNAHVTLLHVIEKIEDPAPHARIRVQMAACEQLKRLVPPDADLWCDLRYETEFGNPAEAILAAALKRPTDLIILSARPVGKMSSHAPWATVSKIVREAECPVLTVRG